MWKHLRQPLSAKGMVIATGLTLLAAATLYGAYSGVTAFWHRQLLERAIPAALAGTRTQRQVLIGLIESYKQQFGYYPPLLTKPGPARGNLNPLCYELLGARFEPKRAQFYIPITKDALPVDSVQKYFNMQSFSNCLPFPALPTNFLANCPLSTSPLPENNDLFGVALGYTDFVPEAFWNDFQFSPFRYVTNPAEHNPGKFDVWIEINVAGKHFTIGNWPEAQ